MAATTTFKVYMHVRRAKEDTESPEFNRQNENECLTGPLKMFIPHSYRLTLGDDLIFDPHVDRNYHIIRCCYAAKKKPEDE